MFSPAIKRLSCILVIVIASAFAIFAGSARADSVTTNPQSSCTADSNPGSGNIVFQDGTLVLTSCHTSSSSFDQVVVVNSGTCHGAINTQVENIVCVKQ